MSKKCDAVCDLLNTQGGALLALLNDLAIAASQRSEGYTPLHRAATEEEVRMRYLEYRLTQFFDQLAAAAKGADHG